MNLESLTDKQLHEMERLLTELTHLMKQAKLTEDPLHAALTQLKYEAGTLRQKRFDENDSRYSGY
jgi:hypothetical protein